MGFPANLQIVREVPEEAFPGTVSDHGASPSTEDREPYATRRPSPSDPKAPGVSGSVLVYVTGALRRAGVASARLSIGTEFLFSLG